MGNKPQDYRDRFMATAEMIDAWRSGDVSAIYARLVELKLYSPHSHKADCSYKINETISDLRKIDAIINNHKEKIK
jgi:hypothetical protein